MTTTQMPKYERLAESIRNAISNNELRPGDELPPERDLAKGHGVSRPTVRAALDALAQEGLLSREQGRGTFIAKPRIRDATAVLTLVYSLPNPDSLENDAYIAGLAAQVAMAPRARVAGARILPVGPGEDAATAIAAAGGTAACAGGVLFVGLKPPSDALLAALGAAGVRSVMIGQRTGRESVPSVVGDAHRTGEMAARHLLAHGHRRLALVDGPWDHQPCLERRAGFLAAATAGGAEVLVVDGVGWDRVATAAAARAALVRADRPTAVAVFGDHGTAGVFDAARDLRLTVPRDLAVVATHLPAPLTPLAEVPLTAFVVPFAAYIQAAIDALAQEPQADCPPVRVPDRLVIGRSCGCVERGV